MTATEETLLGTETLALEGAFWHQSIHAVKKSGSGDYPVGEHRIDLRCKLERGLLQGDLLVGENPTEHLNNLDFTIQLRGARKIFSALETQDTTEDKKSAMGFLLYHSPILPKALRDYPPGIAEELKSGSVTGWAFFDDDALWEIARLLPIQPQREIYLSITARAAATPKPGLLIYEKQENLSTTYRWTGEQALVI